MSNLRSILSGGDAKSGKKATAKKSTKKVRVIDLGAKKITIKHPGVLKAEAKRAGESTKQFARAHDKGKGVTARQSRSALGLMALGAK